MSRVSVLIPNWNGAADTIECLESLARQDCGPNAMEVLVVDNGSVDGSIELLREKLAALHRCFRRAVLIPLKENLGPAGAYNAAYNAVSADCSAILRLDNDVILPPYAISYLLVRLDTNMDVAVVGCRIISGDRSRRMEHHFGAMIIDWWRGQTAVIYPQIDRECDGVAGCAMLIRRSALTNLPFFFDSSRFLANELELCLRLKNRGWKILYTPNVEIYHKGARSSNKVTRLIDYESRRDGIIVHLLYNRGLRRTLCLLGVAFRAVVKYMQGQPIALKAMVAAGKYYWIARRDM